MTRFLLLLLPLLCSAAAAAQTTIVVNTLSDTSSADHCTLRDALEAAYRNAAVGGCAAGSAADTIRIAVTGTIRLAGNRAWGFTTEGYVVRGPGAALLTIDASAADIGNNGVFYLPYQAAGQKLDVAGVTITGAETAFYVYADEAARSTLRLADCVVTGNAKGENDRSAVYVRAGTAHISDCRITNNGTAARSQNVSTSGAVWIDGATLTMERSTLAGNIGGLGGALTAWGGSAVTLRDVTFADNRALSAGGAASFMNNSDARMHLERTTLMNNTSDGGGGALDVRATSLDLVNSTVSGNEGRYGGGIAASNGAELRLYSTTVTNNVSTDAEGNGGGIWSFLSNTVLSNSIVAGNRDTGAGERQPDLAGRFASAGFNLIGDPTGAVWQAQPSDLVGTAGAPLDPALAPLADNGGPTMTHLPMAHSPAVDAAAPGGCLGPGGVPLATDQRGAARAQGGRCDIGAVESDAVGTATHTGALPARPRLGGAYPNPFNPRTTITYTLQQAARARLAVYDVLGREVALLVEGVLPAGTHAVHFDGAGLPSGVYFYRLETGLFAETGRMTLLK